MLLNTVGDYRDGVVIVYSLNKCSYGILAHFQGDLI